MKRAGACVGGLVAMVMILGLMVVPGARASSSSSFTAGGPQSFTMLVSPVPCLPEFGLLSVSGFGVFHVNVNSAGDGWVTATITGSFFFAPTDSKGNLIVGGVTYSGSTTQWFGGNFNLQNFVATGIIELNGVGSDGSTLTMHLLMSITVTPSGTVTASPLNAVCGS